MLILAIAPPDGAKRHILRHGKTRFKLILVAYKIGFSLWFHINTARSTIDNERGDSDQIVIILLIQDNLF